MTIKESDLAETFINTYPDWDMYYEVPFYGIIDLVINDPPVMTAVEFKTNLSFKVIEQAYINLEYFNYSFVAVPKPKSGLGFAMEVCRKYGIGIFTYDHFWKKWSKSLQGKFNRNVRRKPVLKEYMKRSVCGSQNDRVTAYSYTIEQVVSYLKRNGGKASFKECFEKIDHHYANIPSARNSIYAWCRTGLIKEFYIEKGIIILKS